MSKLQAECAALEAQVGQLQRAKTTMDLLAGVAHDLAAALTGVVWCSQAISRRLESHDPELAEGVSDFVAAADFARQLARRLVSISRQPTSEVGPCRVADVVREAASLLEALRPPKARLHIASVEAELWVAGNSDQLQQVLLNLVANAFAALAPSGGNVYVDVTSSVTPSEHAQSAPSPGGYLLLQVRDDGHGMDEVTLQRAFEPFFTTKPAHEGSGLGLHLVRRMVERHGGFVSARSALDRGTVIDVVLPKLALESGSCA